MHDGCNYFLFWAIFCPFTPPFLEWTSFLNGLPAYLYKLITKKSHQYITRNVNDFATYQCMTDALKFSFFPWPTSERNKTDTKIRNSTYSVFRNYLLKETMQKPSPLHNIHNPSGIKLLNQ